MFPDDDTTSGNPSKTREQLFTELRDLRQVIVAVVESSDDAIIGTTVEGIVTTWNTGAERIFGYTVAEATGQPVSMLFPADLKDEAPRILERLRAGERINRFDTIRIAKDGQRHPLCVTLSPLRDCNGRVTGASETGRDLTQLRAALASAESANEAKDRLLGMLSHELRTPLTPVLASISHLETSPDLPEGLRGEMEVIRRNVETEARLVDDLLDLTLIRRGKVPLHFEVVDIHAALHTALDSLKNEMNARGFKVTVASEARDHHVWADPGRLQQVFVVLLSNAMKFSPDVRNLSLRSTSDETGRLRVQVSDSGIGIEPDVIERLFDAFEQGEKTVTRQYGGLGLGLSLAKSLVEMQDGTLSAASEGKGKGATFTVEFNTVPAARRQRPTNEAGARFEGCRVLLVEDHDDTRHVLARLLKSFGCVVTGAGSVREALQLADKEQFDLLVSDIGLPDGSGTEIMKHVKSRYPIKGIALSGFGRDEDLRRSKEAGFERHLTKPVDFQTLKDVIRQVAS